MHEFSGLDEVQEALDELSRRDEPLVVRLERQPGQKDPRYAHLLSGEPVVVAASSVPTAPGKERGTSLEEQVATLRDEVESLKQTFEEFRKQFE